VIVVKGSDCIKADKITIASGIPERTLIKRASRGFGDFLRTLPGRNFVFVIGRGNNAADGVFASGFLKKQVEIFCLFPEERINENLRWAIETSKRKVFFQASISRIKNSFKNADWIVDCIFGTGFRGEVKEPFKSVIQAINDSKTPVVSCDVPSGINSDTGQCQIAVKANFTVTFGYPKLGLFLPPARDFSGSVRFVDIGLKKVKGLKNIELITPEEISKKIPEREPSFNKYRAGHVLIFAGKMQGASILAGLGALKSGAGLLTFFSKKKINFPEAIRIDADADIFGYIKRKKVKAVVWGCGWGREDASLLEILEKIKVPKVIDADGIFLLKKFSLFRKLKNYILTPHTGEIRNLTSGKIVPPHSWKTLLRISKNINAPILLKGHQTAICDGKKVYINPTGNPILSTGGTGDLLSGMIAGFIAQGLNIIDASRCAAYIHGLCADILFKEKGDRGFLIREIAKKIPVAIRNIEKH